MTKTVKLSTPQWEMIKYLREVSESVWLHAVNKKVVAALIKKDLVKITKDQNVTLTPLGKSIDL